MMKPGHDDLDLPDSFTGTSKQYQNTMMALGTLGFEMGKHGVPPHVAVPLLDHVATCVQEMDMEIRRLKVAAGEVEPHG